MTAVADATPEAGRCDWPCDTCEVRTDCHKHPLPQFCNCSACTDVAPPPPAVPDAREAGREWQDGDRVWLDGAVWRRQPCFGGHSWWSDVNDDAESDVGMTAAGAVLLATAAGPFPPVGEEPPTGYRDSLHAALAEIGQLREALAAATVPVGEVREEWGVQYRWVSDGRVTVDYCSARFIAEHMVFMFGTNPDVYADAILVRRPVITTPWEVVFGE